ncbi:VOC family protein [Neptunicella marina]|uniref:VOC family protein n=1 Tax=Neptunicella marina TaxID=2125989 RepID=A0A8J6LYD9_9ALTE|nr:VOC family protein [Neptunicella marina]MBC3766149.1 VOC family protein [Neptunicella marina]
MTAQIIGLGQLAITVSDVNTALEFYRDILGLTFLFTPADNLAFLQSGSTRIMLSTPQGAGEVGKNSVIYFNTTDVQKTYQQALDKGATAERAPQMTARLPDHELWIGFIKDPDGNLIGLMQEKH